MQNNNLIFTVTGVTNSDRRLHTPGDFAKKNLLYVQEVGTLRSLQQHKSQRENLESILFLGVSKGKGEITIEDTVYSVAEGDCVIINCQNYYAHESSEDDPWNLIWVHFYGAAAEAYYELFLEQNNGNNLFHPKGFEEFERMIEKLISLQNNKDLEAELVSNWQLWELLNRSIINVMKDNDNVQEQEQNLCNNVRKHINEHFGEDALVEKVCRMYKMDQRDLDGCFFKTYGIRLEAYIVNRRFTACKEMLRFTAKPLNSIANEVGINDMRMLYELFLKEEGMSPEEYRMKWSQWVK